MTNIQRILCPTDLSSESDEALRYAVALTCAHQAKLLLLYCVECGSERNRKQGESSNAEIVRLFPEVVASHLGLTDLRDLDWEGLVADNVEDVGKAIVEEAARHKADLIVMRSRRRPHAALLLGSTAETVSRTAPCPVLVTHPIEREWVGLSTGEIDLHRVLVAHDFSADAELALKYGVSFAQECRAELHLLHVLTREEQDEPEVTWSHVGLESLYKTAAHQLRTAVPKDVFLWCKVVNSVRCGKAYQEVLAYAKEHEIDLICMGASGAALTLGTLFGSTVDRVLRQAPCPVFVARPVRSAEMNASACELGAEPGDYRVNLGWVNQASSVSRVARR